MAVEIPFQKTLEFEYGQVDELSPQVRRVIANNPSPFTFYGTGTYIVGHGTVAVIDPGPADPEHINAILSATKGEIISHLFVTHTHIDHSPGCALLQQHTDAISCALGSHGLGRARDECEFGADWEFTPDRILKDQEIVAAGDWSLSCVYSPGHAANHLSYWLESDNALFCGDAVMGWSTTIVSPPDGNMKDYMQTLQRFSARDDRIYYPTHGAPIKDPQTYVQALIDHRIERENQVIDCVRAGVNSLDRMLPEVYSDLDKSMYPAAAQSLLATIVCLLEQGRLQVDGEVQNDSILTLGSE